jgi:choloylglycine hydrolase
MCTAITRFGSPFFFGRNMDLDYDFSGEIIVTPRNFPFSFLSEKTHYAIMGMARTVDGFPLYADAMNEKGLCMAALNFPQSGYYFCRHPEGKQGVASFEMIPLILSLCSTVREAEELLQDISVTNRAFREDIPPTLLHWIVSDQSRSLSIEPRKEGLCVTHNPFGVLTNEPPFSFHCKNAELYQDLSPILPRGALGLPGDYSSPSRFIKATYLIKSQRKVELSNTVAHMFRILQAVAPPKGSVILPNGKPHYTVYSCCMEPLQGCYHYQRYDEINTVTQNIFAYPLNESSLHSAII